MTTRPPRIQSLAANDEPPPTSNDTEGVIAITQAGRIGNEAQALPHTQPAVPARDRPPRRNPHNPSRPDEGPRAGDAVLQAADAEVRLRPRTEAGRRRRPRHARTGRPRRHREG